MQNTTLARILQTLDLDNPLRMLVKYTPGALPAAFSHSWVENGAISLVNDPQQALEYYRRNIGPELAFNSFPVDGITSGLQLMGELYQHFNGETLTTDNLQLGDVTETKPVYLVMFRRAV